MIQRSVSQTVRPTSGAMNLNANQPDAKQAFFAAGFTFVSILVMAIGGLIIVWSAPTYGDRWSVVRFIGCGTGLLIAIFAFVYAFTMGNITIGLWQGYQRRLDDWHNAELEMYLAQRGAETITEISQLELTPQVAGHVLLTALAIQHRLAQSPRYTHAPWSVRGLEEKIYLAGTNNSVLLGEITGTRPELMSDRLAQLGLIRDRKPGAAGVWVPESYEHIFDLFAKNWSKLR